MMGEVTYFKWWTESKAIQKMEEVLDQEEALEIWKKPGRNLKQQIHRKLIQVFSLNSIKEKLKSFEILMRVDFSESFKNANQDEIQSASFGQACFSIFTACVYVTSRESNEIPNIPIIVTTDTSNEHSHIKSLHLTP